jgi:ribosomal protein S18 acetylase RimI-like enzyme
MKIRSATTEDLSAIQILDEQFWLERQEMLQAGLRFTERPMPAEILQGRMDGPDTHCIICELDSAIVGYLVARIQDLNVPGEAIGKEGRVCDLYVTPEHRRKGIATSLYQEAKKLFEASNCILEGLTVYPTNPAFELYKKWGFVEYSVNMKLITESEITSG